MSEKVFSINCRKHCYNSNIGVNLPVRYPDPKIAMLPLDIRIVFPFSKNFQPATCTGSGKYVGRRLYASSLWATDNPCQIYRSHVEPRLSSNINSTMVPILRSSRQWLHQITHIHTCLFHRKRDTHKHI